MIPCLASRKDAALHALLGSRQKLVVCSVHISVSELVINRNGNETLPSLQCLSLMDLRAVHPPGCRAVSAANWSSLEVADPAKKEAHPAVVLCAAARIRVGVWGWRNPGLFLERVCKGPAWYRPVAC